jgi:hypothetical protein
MEPITTNRALRAPWKEPCWLISEVPPSTRQSPWLYQHPRLGFLQYRNNLLHSDPFLLHAKLPLFKVEFAELARFGVAVFDLKRLHALSRSER